ncbi:hypothetical protein HII31_03048 [Pseudocercospora fuligena]|uniref:Uncharacterized protein n=1 Tax=Pseudocercospora fuligena TaxID=685502 RepID=A0A8H6VL42_9PEZI|nr:hypothetical protein HII31_03048 [Pseudocercospora fuligena]
MSPYEDLAARKLEYEAIPIHESALRSTLATPPTRYHSLAQEVPDKPVSSVSWQQLTLRQRPCEAGHSMDTSGVCYSAPNQVAILLCSDKSILEAVDTVKHPIKGRFVEKLTFALEEVVGNEMVLRRRKWWHYQQIGLIGGTERLDLEIERSECEVEAMAAQSRIRAGDVDLAALTELFKSVKDHGKLVGIELAHGDEEMSSPTFPRPEHFEEYKDVCCRHGFAAPASDNSRPFEVLLKAVAISGVEVKSLTVARSFEDGAWALPVHLIMMKDDIATYLQSALSRIEKLDLSVWVESIQDEIQHKEYATTVKDSVARFAKVLAEAPKLKALTLHTEFDSYNFDMPGYSQTSPAILLNTQSAECRSLIAALLEQTFPQLEALAISFGDLDVEKLLTFVKRQPKLEKLNLEAVNLLVNGRTQFELEGLVEQVCATVPGSFNYDRIGGTFVG